MDHKAGGGAFDARFLATKGGVAISRAFIKIESRNRRRAVVELIESLAKK